MSRWVLAIALSWSVWVAAQPALVHARVSLSSELGSAICGEGSQTVSWDELLSGSEERRMPELQRTLVSQYGQNGQADDSDPPPAWCISASDPRCAPRDQGAPLDGPSAHLPMQDVTAMRWPDLAAQSGDSSLSAEQLGAPRAGVGLRLERPPRS